MDVYRQAADIIRIVHEGNGTAKALCLRKEMQKKKQTYAVVCETLRHYELLEDVLEVAEFFKYYPNANKEFALCMAYDVVLGKGVHTNSDTTARAVTASASYLREAYWKVYKHHTIPPRTNDKFDEAAGDGESGKGGGGSLQVPRYARVNTLKIDKDTLIERLRRAAEARKRPRDSEPAGEEGGEGSYGETELPRTKHSGAQRGQPSQREEAAGASAAGSSKRVKRVLPDFTEDAVVPSLLVFPPGTDLHAHPAVRSGQLVLQDRASCLPACVLLDAVPVVKSFEPTKAFEKPLEYIIDACAAPGNKTTQLAALGAPDVKIMATERDEHRAALLQRRVQTLGAADYVNVVNMDFFQLASADRDATEAILLDPSCSASGVVTRVDVALMRHHQQQQQQQKADGAKSASSSVRGKPFSPQVAPRHATNEDDNEENDYADTELPEPDEASTTVNPDAQSNEFSSNEGRVDKLARLQRKLLAHALLSFNNCRTVVYSTCSVHEEENENVVRQVLEDERVQARGWVLSNILPGTWKSRGVVRENDPLPMDYTIRCDPAVDATNGFYVARFDRPL